MEEKNKEKLEEKLKECEKLRDEYLNKWKRERADLLNYKKEEAERVSELMKFVNEGLIFKFLAILDNIYIAEKKLPEELKNNLWVEGFLKIKTQILDFLKSQGIKEIDCLGKKFDPNFQEVIEEVEVKDKEPRVIVEEIKKGYKLHGKVIRPAKVKVVK